MTREEFEQLYEQTRARAVAAAAKVVPSADDAEDAVQEAAMFCLQRIETQPGANITTSYFISQAVARAKNRTKPRGRRHGTGDGPGIELARGTALDLDHYCFGPVPSDPEMAERWTDERETTSVASRRRAGIIPNRMYKLVLV